MSRRRKAASPSSQALSAMQMAAEVDPGPAGDGAQAPDPVRSVIALGETDMVRAESNIYCLPIIGQIEGHMVLPPQNKTTKYEHVIPQLVAVEQNEKIEGLLIILNTVGGDVEAGLAIAEMIASLSKPKVSLVLGGGHSIGVPIAVSADYSFIAETASMTVHPIRLTGMVIGVPQSFEYLEKMQERVTRFVVQHSRISEQLFRELMLNTGEMARDIGTTVVGRDAVRYGLLDEVGGVGQAMAKLNELIEAYRQRKSLAAAGPAQAGQAAAEPAAAQAGQRAANPVPAGQLASPGQGAVPGQAGASPATPPARPVPDPAGPVMPQ